MGVPQSGLANPLGGTVVAAVRPVHRTNEGEPSPVPLPAVVTSAVGTLVSNGADVPYDIQPAVLSFRAPVVAPRGSLIGGAALLDFWDLGRTRRITTLTGFPTAPEIAQALGSREVLERVSGAVAEVISAGRAGPCDLDLVIDRRFADYICDLSAQTSLEGPLFGRRRTYLRAVQKLDPPLVVRSLDPASRADADRTLAFMREWMDDRDGIEMHAEYECAEAALTASGASWLRGVIVEQATEVLGIGLWSVTGQTAVAHVVKAVRDGRVTAWTWQNIFAMAFAEGAKTMNCGYDAGLAGLRRAKLGLTAAAIQPRYVITAEL